MHNYHSIPGLSSRVFGGGEAGGVGGDHRRGRGYQSASTVGQAYPPVPVKCPRCDSENTKFCYYNNYNLSQPRHFCKSCRRYWTKGGVLRNVPVGGGCRKPKRSASKSHRRVTPSSSSPDSLNILGSSSSNPNPTNPAFDLPTGDAFSGESLSILMGETGEKFNFADQSMQNIPDPAPLQPIERQELMHQMVPGEIPDDGGISWLPVADGGIFEIAGAGYPAAAYWSHAHWTSDGDPPLYHP